MYKKKKRSWLKHLDFMLLDILALQMGFIVAYWIRNGVHNPYENSFYLTLAVIMTMVEVCYQNIAMGMAGILRRGYWREAVSCLKSDFWVIAISALYLFATKESALYSRKIIFGTAVFYPLLNYLIRVFWKWYLNERHMKKSPQTLFLVGTRERLPVILDQLKDRHHALLGIRGVVVIDEGNGDEPVTICNIPVVANHRNMADYIRNNWVDELLVDSVFPLSQEERNRFNESLSEVAFSGVVVHSLIDMRDYGGRVQFIERFGGMMVMTDAIRSVTVGQAFLKRTMDIAGGLVGCVLAGIAMLIVGPIIKKESPGPLLFKQERIGKNGKPFTMYKIRSMVVDAEARKAELAGANRVTDGMMFKLDFDPRIIGCEKRPDGSVKKGIGNFIREKSIDELPQFFNVLKGDMSLVGTRSPTIDEWNKYRLHHRARMAFRPGLTGLWQVSGRSEITDFDEVVKLDLEYISHWDIGMDMRILFKTFKVVLFGRGAL